MQTDVKCFVLYEAYRSHISLEVLELFLNGIKFYALPAHMCRETQPVDVVIFSAFKVELNNAVTRGGSGFTVGRMLDIFDLCCVQHGKNMFA